MKKALQLSEEAMQYPVVRQFVKHINRLVKYSHPSQLALAQELLRVSQFALSTIPENEIPESRKHSDLRWILLKSATLTGEIREYLDKQARG
jgi:hypothetical protein